MRTIASISARGTRPTAHTSASVMCRQPARCGWWAPAMHPRSGPAAIDYGSADEHALARRCVVKDGALYRMWFSCRGESYRLGYAESGDGLAWTRRDEAAGLEPAATGWDSEMIAYPFVFEH